MRTLQGRRSRRVAQSKASGHKKQSMVGDRKWCIIAWQCVVWTDDDNQSLAFYSWEPRKSVLNLYIPVVCEYFWKVGARVLETTATVTRLRTPPSLPHIQGIKDKAHWSRMWWSVSKVSTWAEHFINYSEAKKMTPLSVCVCVSVLDSDGCSSLLLG